MKKASIDFCLLLFTTILFCTVSYCMVFAEAGWSIQIQNPMEGEIIRPLLGVNAGPYPSGDSGNKDLTAEYRQIGVNQVRTHDFYGPFDMSQMYPNRNADPALLSSYNFKESDIRFQAILKSGAEPYFRIGDSYNNVKPPASAELSNWVQAAVNIIRHYRQGLWDGFTSDFTYIEIGNEPDYEQFWPKPFTMMDFFKLYVQTATAIKHAFPDILVGGPGWTHNIALKTEGQQTAVNFLNYISSSNAPLDFISWHIYSNSPEDFRKSAQFYRSLLDTKGFETAESHITEWNTDARNATEQEAINLRVKGKGAALASAFWIELQNNRTDVSTFFRGNDTSMNLVTFYGLYQADGAPKKVADAFSLWSRLCQYPVKLKITGSSASGSPQLYLLGGQKNDKEPAVLIVNPSDEETTYSLQYAGTGTFDMDKAVIRINQVNDDHSGIYRYDGAKEINRIAGRTVQLVQLVVPKPVGKEPGFVQTSVPVDQPVQLFMNSTNVHQDTPLYEWLVCMAICSGVPTPPYLISNKGSVVWSDVLQDIKPHTFPFDPSGLTEIATLSPSDIGSQPEDIFYYAYMYQNQVGMMYMDNIVAIAAE